MPAPENATIYGIQIRESADDGSDFTNAAADYRKLFLGEDGLLHLKDSAGTVTTVGGTALNAAHTVRAARASGNVTLGNNTYTVVGFDAETYDTDTMHDNSTNPSRFVVPSISGVTTGLWRVAARGYTNATSGRSDMMFRKNANAVNSGGTLIGVVIGGPISSSGVSTFQGADECVLSAGDYVELFARTTGGSFSLVFEADDSPILTMTFLGKVT